MKINRSSSTQSLIVIRALAIAVSLACAACSTIRADERNANDIEPTGPTDQNTAPSGR